MNAIVEQKQGALAHSQNSGRMAVADIIAHIATVQEVMRAVMKPDIHYGIIPGTPKPTLFKQGAEVLCMVFRIADTYQVEDLSTADTVRYRVTCVGNHQINGVTLGTGMGEASSGEEKYKWRKAVCKEEFDETPANMRRIKHARGKGGSTYKQEQIRTENADLANTILKMANKRAKIAMTINVTACGDMFGQDLEDMDEALREHLTRHGEEQNQASAFDVIGALEAVECCVSKESLEMVWKAEGGKAVAAKDKGGHAALKEAVLAKKAALEKETAGRTVDQAETQA